VTAEERKATALRLWDEQSRAGAAYAANCRGCGVPIRFIVTASGSYTPINEDGGSHFATCPKAATFRKREVTRP
jgi:hypothetical protein